MSPSALRHLPHLWAVPSASAAWENGGWAVFYFRVNRSGLCGSHEASCHPVVLDIQTLPCRLSTANNRSIRPSADTLEPSKILL